jgi:hypothetical protein
LDQVANIGEPQVMAIGGAIGQMFEADLVGVGRIGQKGAV